VNIGFSDLNKLRLKVSLEATGVGTKMFDRWLDHRTGEARDFVKLHAAIDDREAAHSIAITDGTTSDTPLLPYLLNDIDANLGAVRADAGYLSRDNVQIIADLGATPFVRPKKHPRSLSHGRPAWKEMLLTNQRDTEAFAKELNQRWRAEAYFSKMKRRFANALTSRTGTCLRMR
jgi:transposase